MEPVGRKLPVLALAQPLLLPVRAVFAELALAYPALVVRSCSDRQERWGCPQSLSAQGRFGLLEAQSTAEEG